MPSVHALIIFVDIRGFTQWAEHHEAPTHLERLLRNFYAAIEAQFPHAPALYKKYVGDGAMIIQEEDALPDEPDIDAALKRVLADLLQKIDQVDAAFRIACMDFAHRYGYETALYLGWAIVRGAVSTIIIETATGRMVDYVGPNVNRASRLGSVARPWGIVIEQDDFPVLPESRQGQFTAQTRLLPGIATPIQAWVTPEIATQFVPRELLRETPEVHIAGACIRQDRGTIEILIAKRRPRRDLFEELYEGCGGQLARDESFTQGVERHYAREMGLQVEAMEGLHMFYRIKKPNTPLIPGIRFLCRYKSGDAASQHHTDVRWVSRDEFQRMPETDFIEGVKHETLELINRYLQRETLT